MLRFFRAIRQTLINEGKTSKYLRYAVGEILLVMIGILLALQVNNWNEGRKLERDRRELIENLKADFRVNAQRIAIEVEDAEQSLERLDWLCANSGGESTELGIIDLKGLVGGTLGANSFEPVLGTYRSALSTGMIKLIKDRVLQTLFIEFESRVKRLEDYDELWVEGDFTGLIENLRTQLGTIYVLRGRNNYVPKNFQISEADFYALIGTKEVYAYFETRRTLKSRVVRNLRRLKDKNEEILAALESEK